MRTGHKIKQGIYVLPSAFSMLSMFCGFYAIIRATNALYTGKPLFIYAAYAIMLAALFDMFDGRIARMTKSVSNFGVQLDSLADLASFGLAPAILIYAWGLRPYGQIGWLAAFLYFACTALRLARFNTQANTNIKKNCFQGLPCPMAACFVVSTILIHKFFEGKGQVEHFYIVAQMYFTAFLMVSNIKYRSFKELDFTTKKSFSILIIVVLLIIIVATLPEVMFFAYFSIYLLTGIVEHFAVHLKHGSIKNVVRDLIYDAKEQQPENNCDISE